MKVVITRLNKQQDGIGHILMIVLILVVLGAIGFAGYTVANSHKPKATTSTTITSSKSEQAAATTGCQAIYHDANLCKAATHASLDHVSYTATLTSNDPQNGASTMTLKSDGKGNTELNGTSNGAEFNSIELGGASYVQTAGVWYEYPAASNSSSKSDTTSDPASNMNLVLGAGITYKPLGTEACGSLTCFKYGITDKATPGVTQLAWFDNKQYLLREWKYTDAQNATTDMVISYQSVSIAKPSPVQQIQ